MDPSALLDLLSSMSRINEVFKYHDPVELADSFYLGGTVIGFSEDGAYITADVGGKNDRHVPLKVENGEVDLRVVKQARRQYPNRLFAKRKTPSGHIQMEIARLMRSEVKAAVKAKREPDLLGYSGGYVAEEIFPRAIQSFPNAQVALR
jgi:hypothetical protein